MSGNDASREGRVEVAMVPPTPCRRSPAVQCGRGAMHRPRPWPSG